MPENKNHALIANLMTNQLNFIECYTLQFAGS